MREKILIVEDQFVEANNLQLILESAGHEVCRIARSVPAALRVVEEECPTMVLLDIYLQGPLTGIALAPTLREKNIAFIYLSASSTKETLDAAKATYPYGFLVKPARKKDILVMVEIARYLHENSLESLRRRGALEKDQNGVEVSTTIHVGGRDLLSADNFKGIVGKSQMLKTVLNHLKIVAPTDTSVLILGESGTGKERIAECIHAMSSRKSKPMIKVNCAALPANLVESELFGHERGSFTGATEKRIGKFEQAQDSTIFLDEIGELPLEVQVKFLRVLQEKEIDRIGSKTPTRLNVRIITATNRNLEQEVAEGHFRMDLYYRLNVFPILLPPLRERKDDIPLLASHFTAYYSKKIGKEIGISDAVFTNLLDHDWPGNIRELEHAIERAVLLAQGKEITHIDVAQMIRHKNLQTEQKIKTIDEIEREHIMAVLKQCNGKISGNGGAAELLGLNVSTLNSKMKKLGIEKGNPRFTKPEEQ
jgi:two-component system, NtrC family, response regulator HydG